MQNFPLVKAVICVVMVKCLIIYLDTNVLFKTEAYFVVHTAVWWLQNTKLDVYILIGSTLFCR